jgi:hypothetical protein
MYENEKIRNVETILKWGTEDKWEWWGGGKCKIYCKHFCKCHNVLPVPQ